MKKFIGFAAAGGALLPFLAAAQTVGSVLGTVLGIINTIVIILIAAAVAYFMWAVVKYITAKEEDQKGEARNHMIYGIIGLFVMVSVWGLVALLQNTFGVSGGIGPTGGFYACTDANNIAQCSSGLVAFCTGSPEIFAYCQ